MTSSTDSGLGQMLVSAVRYALPRSTHIVGTTCEQVRRFWPAIPYGLREVLMRDVGMALDRNEVGMVCDRDEWESLLEWMRQRSAVTS